MAKSPVHELSVESGTGAQPETANNGTTVKGNHAADAGSGADSVPYFSLFKYADGLDYLYICLGTIGAIANGLLNPVFTIILVPLVNSIATFDEDPTLEPRQRLIILAYVAPIMGALAFFEALCWMRTGERQTLRIRSLYLRAMLRQNVGFFDTQGASSAMVVNSISVDTAAIQDAISEKVGTFSAGIVFYCAGMAVALYLAWPLGLIWLAGTPFILIPSFFYAKKIKAPLHGMHLANTRAGCVAEGAVSSINTVYSFGGENEVLRKYSQSLKSVVDFGALMGLYKSLAIGSLGIGYLVWAIVFWVGSRLTRYDGITGTYVISGGLSAFLGTLGLVAAIRQVQFFAEGCKAAKRIFEVIDRVPAIDPWDSNGEVLDKLEGTLEFRAVEFAYPARPDSIIFQNFSLTVSAGSKVALVGQSGSGKSTVIALLERFYDPIKGQVLVDGIDIQKLQLKWLRTQIGLVSQEPALFATTIKENILLGKEDATFEEVVEAATKSNAHSFIQLLPQGYETQVGERGLKMSGGQKQRIAIARAILKNPPILLLDEATSALDAESEKAVQDALDSVSDERTTVVVAHRLTTIRNADLIAVMKDGQVTEMGTHEKLFTEGRFYASLVNMQQSQLENERREGDLRLSDFSISGRMSSPARMSQSSASFPGPSLNNDNMEMTIAGLKPAELQTPSFRRLLAINLPDWRRGVLGAIGAVGTGALQPFLPFILTSVLITLYIRDNHTVTERLLKYTPLVVALAVANLGFTMLQHYNFAIMGEMMTKRVREKILGKILTFEVGWFDADENSSGVICARLATEANLARALVSDRISILLQTGSTMLVSTVICLIVSWKLTIVMVAVQPIAILSFLAKGQLLRLMNESCIKAQEDSSQLASEAMSHHRTILAFSSERKVVEIFDSMQCSPSKVRDGQRRAVVAGLGLGVANWLLLSTWTFSVWWAVTLFRRLEIKALALTRVMFTLFLVGRVIGENGSLVTDLARTASSVAKIFSIADRKTLIDVDDDLGNKVEEVKGAVMLKNVDFAYPTRPDIWVFNNLNLKLKEGKSAAIVGKSGCGKSTILCLIERFYDPLRGKVYIDGVDIKTLHLKSLRSHIALVSQEPVLFAGTIQENIQYGKETASQTEIIQAANMANAYDFISSLKDGFKTIIGDRGIQLSGGQKQKIAIARAILKNPSILLLDEASSALDAQSEKVVQHALGKMMTRTTTIIVAHRLSTIQNCDHIVVIQDGAVCEQGKHDDLLAKGEEGAYATLFRLQRTHA